VAGRLSLLVRSRAKATPCATGTGGRNPGWAANGRVTVRGSTLPPRPVPGKPLRQRHLRQFAPARSGSSTRSATRQTSRRTPLAKGKRPYPKGVAGLVKQAAGRFSASVVGRKRALINRTLSQRELRSADNSS